MADHEQRPDPRAAREDSEQATGDGGDADGRVDLSRRGVLKTGTGGIVAAGAIGRSGTAMGDEQEKTFDYPTGLPLPFAHGIASGDPLSDRVVLWTRLTYEDPPNGRVPVRYEVATDPDMETVVTRGSVVTGAERDWTVKVDATGLSPATTYYYRFRSPRDGATSIVGRTRTAPAGDVSELRLGAVACSSYWSGYFNAFGRLADRNDLNLIVHCGDHIYDFVDPQEEVRARRDRFDEEYVDYRPWRTLDENRRRYALHYSDPDLLRAHQQHPFSIVWDNHDIGVADDAPASRAETLQAFWEWTPTRPPKPDGSGEPRPPGDGQVDPEDPRYLYRRLPYGTMGDLFLIDMQQWRDPPVSGEELYDDDRSVLGEEQYEWLVDGLLASSERDTRWRVVVNQKPMGPFRLLNPPESLPVPYETITQGDAVFNNRDWNGYPAERRRLFETLRTEGVENNLVVTGDLHGNWCSDLTEDPSPPAYEPATGNGTKESVGVEFAPSSVSRGGADETIRGEMNGRRPDGVGDDRAVREAAVAGSQAVEAAIRASNLSTQFMEWVEHGYGIAHLETEAATMEYWWVPIRERTTSQRLGAQFRSLRGTDALDDHAVREPDPEPTSGSRCAEPAPDPFADG